RTDPRRRREADGPASRLAILHSRTMGEDRSGREDLTLSRDAFMTHVEAVLDPAYRLASVLLQEDAAAEDAVHAATMRAWRGYRRARGEVTSFRTWFLAMVVAECRRARWLSPFRR